MTAKKNPNQQDVSETEIPRLPFLQVLLRVNLQHIAIQDSKASFLLGINFIIVSYLFGRLVEKDMHNVVLIPMVFSLLIVYFSILALKPRAISLKDVHPSNLFYKIVANKSFPEFYKSMEKALATRESMMETILNDFYQTSHVLKRKLFYLRVCYALCLVYIIAALLLLLVHMVM